jgi:hypothetical protein
MWLIAALRWLLVTDLFWPEVRIPTNYKMLGEGFCSQSNHGFGRLMSGCTRTGLRRYLPGSSSERAIEKQVHGFSHKKFIFIFLANFMIAVCYFN